MAFPAHEKESGKDSGTTLCHARHCMQKLVTHSVPATDTNYPKREAMQTSPRLMNEQRIRWEASGGKQVAFRNLPPSNVTVRSDH